jgi:hypothetical protein
MIAGFKCSKFLLCGENGNLLEHLEGILEVVKDIINGQKDDY